MKSVHNNKGSPRSHEEAWQDQLRLPLRTNLFSHLHTSNCPYQCMHGIPRHPTRICTTCFTRGMPCICGVCPLHFLDLLSPSSPSFSCSLVSVREREEEMPNPMPFLLRAAEERRIGTGELLTCLCFSSCSFLNATAFCLVSLNSSVPFLGATMTMMTITLSSSPFLVLVCVLSARDCMPSGCP